MKSTYPKIVMYSRNLCSDCIRSKNFLEKNQIEKRIWFGLAEDGSTITELYESKTTKKCTQNWLMYLSDDWLKNKIKSAEKYKQRAERGKDEDMGGSDYMNGSVNKKNNSTNFIFFIHQSIFFIHQSVFLVTNPFFFIHRSILFYSPIHSFLCTDPNIKFFIIF